MIQFSYHRSHQIGAGSSGVVYAGQVRFGLTEHVRPVAIKVMHESQITESDSVECFAREAQIGYELAGHPNLILTRAYGRTREGCPFLVMDLEGPTLSAIQDQISGDAPVVRSVALAVCAALQHLGTFGVQHGDINLGNIFVSRGGVVKLGDYGRVRRAGSKAGSESSRRDDRRALGLMMYELIAGRSPFVPGEPGIQPLPGDAPADLRCVIHGLLEPAARGLSIADAVSVLGALGRPQATRARLSEPAAAWEALHQDRFGQGDDSDLVILTEGEISKELTGMPGANWRPRRRGKVSWAIPVGTFVLGVGIALLVTFGGQTTGALLGEAFGPERAGEVRESTDTDSRRDRPTQLETDVLPPIDKKRGGRDEARDESEAREQIGEPPGPGRLRGLRRGDARDDGERATKRSGTFALARVGKNAGIRVTVDRGGWETPNTALVSALIHNYSRTRYHAAIVQLLDQNGREVPMQMDEFRLWLHADQSDNRKIPTGAVARLSLRIPNAHKLSGQHLSLVVSEPRNARRVEVTPIPWP